MPVAAIDGISKLTWGLYVPVYCRSVHGEDARACSRARASARCILHNRKVAMSAWKLKWSLSGDRWDFQVNMGPLRARLLPQRTTRRHARAVLSNRKVAMLAWELKCAVSGDRWGFQVNIALLRTRLLPQRTTRRRARARARASARCIIHNRKVAMLAWELKCAFSGGVLSTKED